MRSEIGLLQAKISLLKTEVSLLKEENKSLKSVNKSLREENCQLKNKLGLTSKNSSILSSKALYKLKRNKIKSIHNRGGQPGHAGTTRSRLVANEVIELPILDSCSCGGHVAIAPKLYIHQKVDLPDIMRVEPMLLLSFKIKMLFWQ